jgi:hypothetical protein
MADEDTPCDSGVLRGSGSLENARGTPISQPINAIRKVFTRVMLWIMEEEGRMEPGRFHNEQTLIEIVSISA